jgi:hypothetical protein
MILIDSSLAAIEEECLFSWRGWPNGNQ